MSTRIFAVFVILFALPAIGADEQINSPAAKQAIQKCNKEIEAADVIYRRAVLKARTDCVQSLKVALTVAMHQSKLDDATQIKAEIDRLQKDIDAATNHLKQYRFKIPATLLWNDTIKVTKGQRIKIQVVGEWSPGGPKLGDIKKWPGKIRVGEGASIPLASPDLVFTAEEDGMLQMGISDGESQGTYNDNVGAMTATITILPVDSPDAPAN